MHLIRFLNTQMKSTKALNSFCKSYFYRFLWFIAACCPNCWKLCTFLALRLTGIQGLERRTGLPSPTKGLVQQALTIYNFTDETEWKKVHMKRVQLTSSAWERIFQVSFPSMTNTKSIKSWHSDQHLRLSWAASAKDTLSRAAQAETLAHM